jgi:hypothetical protein
MVMIRFVASDCPSDCGWNADENYSWTPDSLKSSFSFQKWHVNTGSRSLTTEVGMPWRRTMLSKNAQATVVAV